MPRPRHDTSNTSDSAKWPKSSNSDASSLPTSRPESRVQQQHSRSWPAGGSTAIGLDLTVEEIEADSAHYGKWDRLGLPRRKCPAGGVPQHRLAPLVPVSERDSDIIDADAEESDADAAPESLKLCSELLQKCSELLKVQESKEIDAGSQADAEPRKTWRCWECNQELLSGDHGVPSTHPGCPHRACSTWCLFHLDEK